MICKQTLVSFSRSCLALPRMTNCYRRQSGSTDDLLKC
jgi:hypothetical protein